MPRPAPRFRRNRSRRPNPARRSAPAGPRPRVSDAPATACSIRIRRIASAAAKELALAGLRPGRPRRAIANKLRGPGPSPLSMPSSVGHVPAGQSTQFGVNLAEQLLQGLGRRLGSDRCRRSSPARGGQTQPTRTNGGRSAPAPAASPDGPRGTGHSATDGGRRNFCPARPYQRPLLIGTQTPGSHCERVQSAVACDNRMVHGVAGLSQQQAVSWRPAAIRDPFHAA